ncbi:MAG TPA: hypothetical protein VFV63_12235 [Ilumatobacteraceae bacterium]|nr:hypothetical protein [Ilumatobacteraceae bacterium]
MSKAMGIRALADLVARAIAVELVLFEAFGRWISTTSQVSAKPLLAAASRRHGWHAELWRERFPLIPGADADQAVAEARSNLGALVDALAVFDALPSGPGRLAVEGIAATAMARQYRAVKDLIDPLLDAPTARVLELVIADVEASPTTAGDLTDGERVALDALRDAAPFQLLGVA